MKDVIGLLNFHGEPSCGELTASRTVGSTSFVGRYAVCDFMLSNFANSGIETMGVLIEKSQRSVLKHLGSMDSWQKNTKTSRVVVMYNESAHAHPETNTDLQNIAENDWAFYDSDAKYILIAPSYIIGTIDFRPFIEEHIARGEKVSVMGYRVEDTSKELTSQMILDVNEDGYVSAAYPNSKLPLPAAVSLGVYLIDRALLSDIIHRNLPRNPSLSLESVVAMIAEENPKGVHVHMHEGAICCIDSFESYVKVCREFLNPERAFKFIRRDWPIYTKSHDTPPAIYGSTAEISNSIVANGARIEGKVEGSVISRNVKIGKGAVVRNCIILTAAKIGEGAVVENCVIDKYATVTRKKTVGSADETSYLAQGAIV